ncbi:hypothetical protein AABB24_035709 [Solanum stoloniferum]|uniref:Uncharacterized protein n=1 Tax=Solanum stoloniferum TaxID=62892 RepID=A0ABD2RBC4_9SOLN
MQWCRSTSGHLGCCTISNLETTSLLSSHSCRLTHVTYKNLKDFTVIQLNQRPRILCTSHFIFLFLEFNCERTIHPFSYTQKHTFFILILIQLFPFENSITCVQRKLIMNYKVCFPWKQSFLIFPI